MNKTVGRAPAKYSKISSTGLESGKIVRAHDGPNNDGGRKLLYICFLDIVEDH